MTETGDLMHTGGRTGRATSLYRRDLPGGGFVAIDIRGGGSLLGDHVPRTCLYVERRSDPGRRLGHEPPVLAELAEDATAYDMNELYRLAADNVAIARAILVWQARHVTRAD